MSPDRLDALLDAALETGQVPDEATPEERVELEALLSRAGDLRLNAARVQGEAAAAMPTARARFQRHLAEQRPAGRAPIAPATAPQRGFFGRFLGGGAMTFATSAVALGVVAVLAIVILQPFSSPQTAAALTIDDYVQVEGVVTESADGVATVQTPDLGNLEVAFSDLTAVTDASGTREASTLKAGDPVFVSGVVVEKRRISASNVAVAPNQGLPTPSAEKKVPLLKNYREGLVGKLSVISLAPDGKRARVLLVAANERLLVDIDPRAMDAFLAQTPAALGSVVRVVKRDGPPGDVFALELAAAPQATPTNQPGGTSQPKFDNIKGVVIGRTLNVLMVRTDRGTIPVVVRPLTSIRFGDSGLTPDDIRAGESVIGWEIAVSGNPEDPTSKRLIASIIVVIGKAPVRPGAQ